METKIPANEQGAGRLHRAALISETASIVESLLRDGEDANARDEKERTALHIAAAFNETPGIASALVKAGADVNAPDAIGATPLHAAARYAPAPEIVKELLEAGADPGSVDNYGRTALHLAAQSERAFIVEMLLAAGAEIEARDEQQRTPLHLAAGTGLPLPAQPGMNSGALGVLLKARAKVNARDENGGSPLLAAARNAPTSEKIEVLLDAGADPKLSDKYGRTALHFASQGDSPAIVNTLIEAGAELHARDARGGWTPLHLAAWICSTPAVVATLLDAGANTKVRDEDGKTPRDFAEKNVFLRNDAVYERLK